MSCKDPISYLRTLFMEASNQASEMRRDARRLRDEATELERKAEWHDLRAEWLKAAILAMREEEAA